MAIAKDKSRLIITLTKDEHAEIKRIVAARLQAGLKATESGVGAEFVRFALASRWPVQHD